MLQNFSGRCRPSTLVYAIIKTRDVARGANEADRCKTTLHRGRWHLEAVRNAHSHVRLTPVTSPASRSILGVGSPSRENEDMAVLD